MGTPAMPLMPFSTCVDARKMVAGPGILLIMDRFRGVFKPAGRVCSIRGDELGEESTRGRGLLRWLEDDRVPSCDRADLEHGSASSQSRNAVQHAGAQDLQVDIGA